MIRSALIPLDGSESCQRTVDAAIEMAKSVGFALAGIGVVDAAEILKPEPVPMGAQAIKAERDQMRLAEAREMIAVFLKTFSSQCEAAGLSFQVVQSEGRASDEIEKEARRHDLVILNRETHLHFETRDKEKDVLKELARQAGRPLLAFPPKYDGAVGSGILVAYDNSIPATRALQLFVELSLRTDQKVTVLSIGDSEEKARQMGNPAVDFLRHHQREVELIAVASGHHSRVIMDQVTAMRPRVLVMGAFGHAGLKSRIFGTTTNSILDPASACQVPIFLYH